VAEEPDSDRTVIIGATHPRRVPSGMHLNALPVGTMLGEFEVVGLVGEGGFGIVYLAQDHSLHRKVAVKEYMPALLASRGHDASVSIRSERHRATFDIGLRSFVNEARMLAQFDHPALVKVYRFWEANGTAYMAMPFFSGQTLQDALQLRGDAPEEAWIRKVLTPLMDALAIIHEDKVYHRDIAPDNIMLLAGDRPVLLDFGAARRVIGDMSQALTVILKPGYAPIEQYAEMPGMKQGPWTDVYALAAVVYFMILQRKPPPAVSRLMQDSYEPLMLSEMVGRYSDQLLQGIDKCLNLKAQDRPQSIAAMREAIGFATLQAVAVTLPHDKAGESTKPASPAPRTPAETTPRPVGKSVPASADARPDAARSSKLPLVAAGVVVLAVLVGGYAYYARHRASDVPATTATVDAATVETNQAPAAATVPAPPPVPPVATLDAAIDAALAGADPGLSVRLETPATLTEGNDLKLLVRSNSDGLLYLFVWDQVTDRIYRLTPDGKDGGNAIKANGNLAVTHKDAASYAAKEPLGNWRVISMLSEKPRDFSSAAFRRDGDFLVVERGALETRLQASGLSSLFGTPRCAAGESCQDRFAVSVASIAREAAPPPPVAKRAPAAKPASQNSRGTASPGRKTPDSEREYMKRLNKDLDNLLGK
jgi:serine/threonine protein kinase